MEESFDFLNLKWLVPLVVIALSFFGNKKPKVSAQEPEDGEPEAEDPRRSLEKMLGELFNERSEEVEPAPISAPKQGQKLFEQEQKPTGRAKEPKFRYSAVQNAVSTIEADEIGGDNQEFEQVEFDLREAVIMSEVLTRKYDE